MNKFTLSFQTRQTEVRKNSWVRLYTTAGEIIAQYCPCTEAFSIASNGCHQWTYTFCVQDTDLPSAIESVCGITPDIMVEPYLQAIEPVNFEDSLTVEVTGSGTELDPYSFSVILDPDAGNTIQENAEGLYAG